MTTLKQVYRHHIRRSLVFTTLFCFVVAVTTMSVWGGHFYIHMLISFGFGYSAVATSVIIERLFPNVNKRFEYLLAISVSVPFGTLHAQYWVGDIYGRSFSEVTPILLLGLIFSANCFYFSYTREQQVTADKALEESRRIQVEQEKALLLSQLKQMQSQIEPHFLFNTLANISALMEVDVPKARAMLEKLTDLLRVTLTSSREKQSTLASELELVEAYLEIQSIRLDTRLRFSLDVPESFNEIPVPPLLIQPLVENSITHGIEPKPEGGEIVIRAVEKEESVLVTVDDSGLGFQHGKSSGHGVGLSNTMDRVKAFYDGAASVQVLEKASGGVKVELRLPRRRQPVG